MGASRTTGWHTGIGSGWWIIGPIVMIVFWGGLFWLIRNVLNGLRSNAVGGDTGISAKEVAKLRFASGEIDEAEYSRITRRLEV